MPPATNMQYNTLMYVDILFVLPPRRQAYIRSAGSAGGNAFTELVDQHKATTYLEYTPDSDGSVVQIAPVSFRPSISSSDNGIYVAVVSQRYLQHNHLQPNSVYPVMRMKVVGDGVMREIGNALNTSRAEDSDLAHMQYTNMESVTTILDDFTIWYRDIKTLDLAAFTNVTSIGNSFLEGCSDLKTINISSLRNVRSVGDRFLGACFHLTEVDLPFSGVVSIGELFMFDCGHITAIDITALRNIRTVPEGFMAYCSKLKHIDLSPLQDVVSIGSNFLGRCKSLSPLDMSPLRNVTSIGAPLLDGVVRVDTCTTPPSPILAKYLATYEPAAPPKAPPTSKAEPPATLWSSSSSSECLLFS